MRRSLVVVAALALTLTGVALLAPSVAQACSCMRTKDAVTAARDSTVVFEGKLTAIASPPLASPHDLPMKIFTFERARTFKGTVDQQVRVHTTDNSAACGRDFGKVGDTWLIYARADDKGELHDNLCSRTMAIADATADIAELEANKATLDQPNPQPERPEPEVEPADPEPAPIQPVDNGQPEPAEPNQAGKTGCSIGEPSADPISALALLGLLALPWSRSRRRRLAS